MNKPNSILITGASSGIGKKLAELLAHSNAKMCLMGRNKDRLKEIADICSSLGAVVVLHSIDLSDKTSVEKAVLDFNKKFPIDLVIANAGIGTTQSAERNSGTPNPKDLIETNILGMHYVLDPLIPFFKERGSGQIAIMSSQASYRGFSKCYIYAATKAYGRIYGQGLRLDLKRFGIKVSTIAPGFVKTPLTCKNPFKMPLIMDTTRASKIILRGLEKNKSLIAFPKIFHFLTRTISSLPIVIADKIAEKIG